MDDITLANFFSDQLLSITLIGDVMVDNITFIIFLQFFLSMAVNVVDKLQFLSCICKLNVIGFLLSRRLCTCISLKCAHAKCISLQHRNRQLLSNRAYTYTTSVFITYTSKSSQVHLNVYSMQYSYTHYCRLKGSYTAIILGPQ